MADYVITASDVVVDATKVSRQSGVAGETLVAGDIIYDSSGSWFLSDATDENKPAKAICLSGGTATQTISFARSGQITLSAVGLAADVVILSETGNMAPVADLASSDYLNTLGYWESATVLNFNPVATGVQKA